MGKLLRDYDDKAQAGKELISLHATIVGTLEELRGGNGLAQYILKRHGQLVESVQHALFGHTAEATAFFGLGLTMGVLRIMWFPIGPADE